MKDQVQLLRGKMSKLEDANLALQDNSFVLKSDLQMVRGDVRSLSTSQDVLRAAFAEPPRTPANADSCSFEAKRRKDVALEPSAVANQTEEVFQKALSVTSEETRLARKSPHDFFRFLLKEFYKSPRAIVGMKLPPVAGPKKDVFERYQRGDGKYMDKDLCAAVLRLGTEFFPQIMNTLRDARKTLTKCLGTFTAKHTESTPENRSCLDDLPCFMIASQSSSTPMSMPLRTLKNGDNCLFKTPSSHSVARALKGISPIKPTSSSTRPGTTPVVMPYQTPEEAENALSTPLSRQIRATTLNDSALINSSGDSF